MGCPRITTLKALVTLVAILAMQTLSNAQIPSNLQPTSMLWYSKPAANWNEALPVGNGRLGAMIFGGVEHELLQLNDNTFWAGHPHRYTVPNAHKVLPEIRELLFAGKDKEATALADRAFMGNPKFQASYQPIGDLKIDFTPGPAPTRYHRTLDLDRAVHRVEYTQDGVDFTRETFISHPAKVAVVRLEASQPEKLTFRVAVTSPYAQKSGSEGEGTLVVRGQWRDDGVKGAWIHNWDKPGIRFSIGVRIVTDGGKVTYDREGISVEGANSATIFLGTGTSFRDFADISGNPDADWPQRLHEAARGSYPRLLSAHEKNVRELLGRAKLELPETDLSKLPTNERLNQVREGKSDPALAALYFHYGRYLLVSSSRPGGQPANLQGIWNKDTRPAWGSKYTTNINLQMNYWPAEVTNLAECSQPLFSLIDDLQFTGGEVASDFYQSRGWVLHHNTDLWRGAAPVDGVWGVWPMGSAWLARHPWEHYRYTLDKKFLRTQGWPQMKGAARFILDFLVTAPGGVTGAGKVVTVPSHSPENTFVRKDGSKSQFTFASTMDLQIIQDLFENCLSAMKVLNLSTKADRAFQDEIEAALAKLAPMQISPKNGRLQEWIEDFDDAEPGHRHMSHLYGLYPGKSINPQARPDLVEAAKKSLQMRLENGGGGTGWSRAWLVSLYARLSDGPNSEFHLSKLLGASTQPNLLDSHPPFQIDGNFAGTAGIAEMLLQSHLEDAEGRTLLQLLPALPTKKWPTGSLSGLRARGGLTVDLRWADGKLTEAKIHASQKARSVLEYHGSSLPIDLKKGETFIWNPK